MSNAAYLGTSIDNPPGLLREAPLFDISGDCPSPLLDISEHAPVWSLNVPRLPIPDEE